MRSTIRLNNGRDMPVLGLGVWSMAKGAETEQAVLWALEAGYRLIDTAKIYGNEASVGHAVRKSGVPREDIFVTTKLWPSDILRVRSAFQRSLDKLGLAYIDLYLIHWPVPLMKNRIWKEFEKIYAAGLVRCIGVSNYNINQLETLAPAADIPQATRSCFIPFLTRRNYSTTANQRILLLKPIARSPEEEVERSGHCRYCWKVWEDAGSNHDSMVASARPYPDTEIQQQKKNFR